MNKKPPTPSAYVRGKRKDTRQSYRYLSKKRAKIAEEKKWSKRREGREYWDE